MGTDLLQSIISGDFDGIEIDSKEMVHLIEELYGRYLKTKVHLEMELDQYKTLNKKYVDEHNKSLELIMRVEVQKLKKEKKNAEIKRLNKKLNLLNKKDYLTKVYNRKTFIEMAEIELARTIRSVESLKKSGIKLKVDLGTFSIAMLDIDDFKRINDTYGHLAGDRVLRVIGKILNSPDLFRKTDIVGRYGGEEFILLFPGLSASNCIPVILKFINRIRELIFEEKEKCTKYGVTISVGISDYCEGDTIQSVIARADGKLYRAKMEGKNRVIN